MSDDEALERAIAEEKLAFEKARFEYCAALYESETKRQHNLEGKSRFYLSFVTLFLGAVFLNLGFLEDVRALISGASISPGLLVATYGALMVLAISLLISLLSILQSIRLRSYKSAYPADTTYSLFGPNSEYFENGDILSLLKANAMSYTIALEYNKSIDDKKARWVDIAAFNVLVAVIALATFLLEVTYLSLQ